MAEITEKNFKTSGLSLSSLNVDFEKRIGCLQVIGKAMPENTLKE